MKMKKYDFIKKNYKLVQALARSGDVSIKTLTNYSIYSVYLGNKTLSSKMQRYQNTADTCKVSVQSVMRAVKEMEMRVSGI